MNFGANEAPYGARNFIRDNKKHQKQKAAADTAIN